MVVMLQKIHGSFRSRQSSSFGWWRIGSSMSLLALWKTIMVLMQWITRTNITSRNRSGRRAFRGKQSLLLRPSCKREQRRGNHLLLSLPREDRLIWGRYDDTSRRLLEKVLSWGATWKNRKQANGFCPVRLYHLAIWYSRIGICPMVRYGCYEEKRLIAFHLWVTPRQHLRATSRLLHHRQVLLPRMMDTRQPQQLSIWRKQLIEPIFSLVVDIMIWFNPWARKKNRQCPPSYTSFGFFLFKTAKHWGRGPRDWTAETLNFGTYQETVQISLPTTLSMIMNGNSEQWDHFELSPLNASASHISSRPSQMCQWVIHVTQNVENYVSSLPQESQIQDPQDEAT